MLAYKLFFIHTFTWLMLKEISLYFEVHYYSLRVFTEKHTFYQTTIRIIKILYDF